VVVSKIEDLTRKPTIIVSILKILP